MSRGTSGNSTRNALFTRSIQHRHLLTIRYARAMCARATPITDFAPRRARFEIYEISSARSTDGQPDVRWSSELQSGGTNDFRSRDDKSYPLLSPLLRAIRDRESMCVGDPVGSGSLAVLTGNTMDPPLWQAQKVTMTTNTWRNHPPPCPLKQMKARPSPAASGHPRRYRLVLLPLHPLPLYSLYLSPRSPFSLCFCASTFRDHHDRMWSRVLDDV